MLGPAQNSLQKFLISNIFVLKTTLAQNMLDSFWKTFPVENSFFSSDLGF